MWESVTYLANLAVQSKYEYDGTMSLQLALGSTDTPYRECIFEGMKGEKVFFLDSLTYDIIVGFQENLHTSERTVLYFEKRGKEPDWASKCISVKWYEQLKKMVGKKAVESTSFPYIEEDRLWKEDVQKMVPYSVDAIEVKGHKFIAKLTRNGETKEVDAIGKCGLLAYPLNLVEEKEWKKATRKDHLLRYDSGFISYDAALATMPAKPAALKNKEAEDKAYWAEVSKRMDALRNHELIGTSLVNFLQNYPTAKLLNTTTSGGVTIKVYQYLNYQVVFQNGLCTAQRTY